ETLEIDVGGVHVAKELDPWLRADVAGAHRHRLDAAGAAGLRDIHRIFQEDHRVVVGEGDRPAAAADRRLRNLLRRSQVLHPIERTRLGDIPVLAELAGEVAARRPERKHGRPGHEMVERLLLDRIDAETGGTAVGREHDLVGLARAHKAQAALAFVQLAIARADLALDAPVLKAAPVAARYARNRLLIHCELT